MNDHALICDGNKYSWQRTLYKWGSLKCTLEQTQQSDMIQSKLDSKYLGAYYFLLLLSSVHHQMFPDDRDVGNFEQIESSN